MVSTWSSRDPCEFGQILGLPDHHLDALSHSLVLQQDEQLAQSPRRTLCALPVTPCFLRTHTLAAVEEKNKGDLAWRKMSFTQQMFLLFLGGPRE